MHQSFRAQSPFLASLRVVEEQLSPPGSLHRVRNDRAHDVAVVTLCSGVLTLTALACALAVLGVPKHPVSPGTHPSYDGVRDLREETGEACCARQGDYACICLTIRSMDQQHSGTPRTPLLSVSLCSWQWKEGARNVVGGSDGGVRISAAGPSSNKIAEKRKARLAA
jgi:hypothetical protein